MALTDILKKCMQALDELQTMQRHHLTAFENGVPDDILARRNERESVFVKLQEIFTHITYVDSDDKEGYELLLERMKEIRFMEERLEQLVQKRSKEILGELSALRKGKKALYGYSIKNNSGPKPRFLSSKT